MTYSVIRSITALLLTGLALTACSSDSQPESATSQTAYEGVRVQMINEMDRPSLRGASFAVADVTVAPDVIADTPADILNNLAVYTKTRMIQLLDSAEFTEGSAALNLDEVDYVLYPRIASLVIADDAMPDSPETRITNYTVDDPDVRLQKQESGALSATSTLHMHVDMHHQRTATLTIELDKKEQFFYQTMHGWDAVLLMIDDATSDTVAVLDDLAHNRVAMP